MALAMVPARAASPEAQVKAAYLYKLASFVRWPVSVKRRDSIKLCVAGRNDISEVLESLVRGQQIDGMPIEAQAIDSGDVDRAVQCNVLFLGSGPEIARKLAAATDGKPVLTVGDRNNGTGAGVIDFTVRDGRVRFVIDATRARARGLELSSKLLDVAVAIER